MALQFDDTQETELLEALGLEAGTDAATVLLAIADLVTTAPDPSVAASAGGGILIDPAQYETLKASAAQGVTLKAAAAKRDRDTAIGKAISEGRVTPAHRSKWEALLDTDPSMAKVMASMPAIVSTATTELGHCDPGPSGDVVEPAAWIR